MNQTSAAHQATTTSDNTNQLLCFELGGQSYAVDIMRVQEIRRFAPTTALPDVPAYVLGVMNLRGTVVPVFDLRKRFSLASAEIDRNTAIIVVGVAGRSIGVVVDAVNRVIRITPDMIRPTPPLTSGGDTSMLVGLVADSNRLITWLDVERLLRGDIEVS